MGRLFLAILTMFLFNLSAEEREQPIKDSAAYLREIDSTYVSIKNRVYGEVSKDDLRDLAQARDVLHQKLGPTKNSNELSEDDQVVVFNAQEDFNAVAAKKRDSAMYCERSERVGTRMRTTRCITLEERSARQRAAAEELRSVHQSICANADGC